MSLDTAELRPALTRTYSPSTIDCYRRRLKHYNHWCTAAGFTPGAEAITTDKLFDYVKAQVDLWKQPAPAPDDGRRLRPETIKQAINALLYFGERAAPAAPNDRNAKELVRRFEAEFNAHTPPAWRVKDRRSPRRRRAPVPRPRAETLSQPGLFDV